MARKSFDELIADLSTSFPDNISGLITPLVLRTYFDNFLKAIRPSYGLLSRPNSTNQTMELVDAAIVFDTGITSGLPDFTVAPGSGGPAAAGVLTRTEPGMSRLTFNATMEGSNGRLITFTVYRNGVALPWRASATLLGAGKPVDVSIAALSYLNALATYEVKGKADSAGTAVAFSNMDFVGEVVPVNAY